MSTTTETIAAYSSILGLIISAIVLVKSHSIKKEIKKVQNELVLRKRIPKILKSLNITLSALSELLMDVEENNLAIKQLLIECHSILNSIAIKLGECEIKTKLIKTKSMISRSKNKKFTKEPSKHKIFREYLAKSPFYPFIYQDNLQAIKNELDGIYNDLKSVSLDQKEL